MPISYPHSPCISAYLALSAIRAGFSTLLAPSQDRPTSNSLSGTFSLTGMICALNCAKLVIDGCLKLFDVLHNLHFIFMGQACIYSVFIHSVFINSVYIYSVVINSVLIYSVFVPSVSNLCSI